MYWAIFQILGNGCSRLAAIQEEEGLAKQFVANHKFNKSDFSIVSFITIAELASLIMDQDEK